MWEALRESPEWKSNAKVINLPHGEFKREDLIQALPLPGWVTDSGREIHVDLKWCTGLKNEHLASLGAVHTLNLRGCTGITDVSALGTVHTLTLQDCPGITNVSALGAVHNLNLQDCLGVTDVGALGSVHTLILRWCAGVTDMSELDSVHTLKLFGFNRQATKLAL